MRVKETSAMAYRAEFLRAEYRYHEAMDARADEDMVDMQEFVETISADEWVRANEWRMGSELQ